MKRRNRVVLIFTVILLLSICLIHFTYKNKNLFNPEKDINSILQTDAYSYLPYKAKNYIKEVYEDTGEVLLTEQNKEENAPYLNPLYIEYLNSGEQYDVIPSPTIVDYVDTGNHVSSVNLPSVFTLKDVDGKNFVTPYKNQGSEGLCWDYAINAHIESFLLVRDNKTYDSSATILSEKQIDYATAGDAGIIGNNALYPDGGAPRAALSGGGTFSMAASVMINGLGIVPKSWDTTYHDVISVNGPLDGSAIYDFNNSLYELNTTIDVPYLNLSSADEETRTNYLNSIKQAIINYGGAYVSTDVCYDTVNTYNGANTTVVDVMSGGGCLSPMPHALQIIGWDDDFEYTVCKKTHGSVRPNECGTYGSVTGTGVWILKNSWGSYKSTVLLAYDSLGSDIHFVTDLGNRTWDNFYKLKYSYANSTTYTYSFKETEFVTNEKLNKLKLNLGQNTTYTIYIDINGTSNYQQIRVITSEYSGFYSLDFSSDNYNINKNTVFKIVKSGSGATVTNFMVYTDNNSNTADIQTAGIHYGYDDEIFNNSNLFNFNFINRTKNIDTGEQLTFKIKDSNDNYVNTSSYSYDANKVYANVNSTRLTIDSNYFSKGEYTIEAYYDNQLYGTAPLNIEVDIIPTYGDGSEEDPWQITNVRQFNAIRNRIYDSFILMNDLDFEEATTDEKGIFYNDGNGFHAIENFQGYLNGNGHKIKNLYSHVVMGSGSTVAVPAGIFDVSGVGSNCRFTKCGIENLTVVNPHIEGAYTTGGIVNNLYISDLSKYVFNNNAVIGGIIKTANHPSYTIGGLIGSVNIADDGNHNISFNNLYNSAHIVGFENIKSIHEQLGGVFGVVSAVDDLENFNVSFNNLMNVGVISNGNNTINNSSIANVESFLNSNITFKNIISLNNPDSMILGASYDYFDGTSLTLTNLYTDSSTIFHENIEEYIQDLNYTNANTDLTAMEIANGNYTNWDNFANNWTQYNADGVKRIPILKNIYFDYFAIDSSPINIGIGESLDIDSLVTSQDIDYVVTTSCDYNLSICNNETDLSVLSLDDTNITGLSMGTTSIIVYSPVDGYINTIMVNVGIIEPVNLSFNANGGTGNMADQSFTPGVADTINSNVFTKTGYIFASWNTKANGSGTSYENNASITIDDDTTLYAIWSPINYTISFNANGGTGSMSSINAIYDQDYTLSNNTFTKDKHRFVNWNTKANGTGISYSNEQVVNNITAVNNDEIILYAQWEEIKLNITFDSNGGTGSMSNQQVTINTATNLNKNTFTREGYRFIGWNTQTNGSGTTYTDEQSVTLNSNITLYAQWSEIIPYTIQEFTVDEINKYITKIMVNTELNYFTSKIILGYGYGIYVDYLTVDNKNVLYTGGKTRITKGLSPYKEYTNIVIGDTNGDGEINSSDLLAVRLHLRNMTILNGAYYVAADVNYDNDINSTDLLALRLHLRGITPIK